MLCGLGMVFKIDFACILAVVFGPAVRAEPGTDVGSGGGLASWQSVRALRLWSYGTSAVKHTRHLPVVWKSNQVG